MKKRIIMLIIIAVLVLASIAVTVIHASADDTLAIEEIDDPEVTETIAEIETVAESGGVYIDDEAVSELIAGADSKIDAVIMIASLFGISVEDAETVIDNFIAFGDQHFEDSDLWASVKSDANAHPEKWVMIAFIVIGFMALIVFLIRCLIKNALTQTNTKLKLKDIDKHEEDTCLKLDEIKILLEEIKEKEAELDELKGENKELKGLLQSIKELIDSESAMVDSLKANSETSLKVTEETALQIVQLLNIAMDRKVPIASAGARKLWFEDSVKKIKEKAGLPVADAKSE